MSSRFFLLLTLLSTLAPKTFAQSSRKIKLNPVSLGIDLPESYRQRTFIKGLSGFVNNIDQLVGAMVLVEGSKTSVLTRFVRQDKPPVLTSTTSDVIYNAKIDTRFRFNGAYCIASTKVERDAIYELVITDMGVAFLPEDYIPYLDICKASINVPAETKRKTFYIRSAKLTTVYTRAFHKVMGEQTVSGIAFSAGGEVYSSTDQFKVDYIVSVDMVSLEKMLTLQSCPQMIASEEKAQATKPAVETPRGDPKASGNDVELAATVDSNATMPAQNPGANSDGRIVRLKNKEGKVLEIKSLEELSLDKLREMGFDVEVLEKDE